MQRNLQATSPQDRVLAPTDPELSVLQALAQVRFRGARLPTDRAWIGELEFARQQVLLGLRTAALAAQSDRRHPPHLLHAAE
jgi:hypothetical protein